MLGCKPVNIHSIFSYNAQTYLVWSLPPNNFYGLEFSIFYAGNKINAKGKQAAERRRKIVENKAILHILLHE